MTVGSKVYRFFEIKHEDWSSSQIRCRDVGMELVEIGSLQEETRIDKFLKSIRFYLIYNYPHAPFPHPSVPY